MAVALLLARLLLSVIFLIAGLTKLADLPGSQKALQAFGVPGVLARPLGIVLPVAEIAIASALISTRWALYGARGALVLLLIFIAGISYNLARGRRPNCHCFGQLHSTPIGPSTLIRNILLALVAGSIVYFGGKNTSLSVISWFAVWSPAQQITFMAIVLALLLIACGGWILVQTLSHQGRLLLRIERLERRLAQTGIVFGIPEQEQSVTGLPVGSKAPDFLGNSLGREIISLKALRAPGKLIALVFTNPHCAPCSELIPEIERWQRDYQDKLTVALISRGSVQDNQAKASEHHLTRLIIQEQDEIDRLYNVQGTPSAVLIHPDGLIESSLAVGPEKIQKLVEKAIELSQEPPPPLPLPANNHHKSLVSADPIVPGIGTPAPAFSLPDLDGASISLSSFLGHPTIILFWRPDCGFCKKMLAALKAWEADLSPDEVRLLIISSGTLEANRAMGLRSPVLLSKDNHVGQQFGATGTPMAILVDSRGKIASALAEGSPEVLELANAVKRASKLSRV
ncbi:MAG TPA: redoxin domain-containing protein [Ktedonobacteraceae bacterium]|nr:redoxin domain-containing protein [Ktedonobacteraceae bacterium]